MIWTTAANAQECRGTRTILDRNFEGVGGASRAEGIIVLNPRELSRRPAVVRRFIYAHECGHHRVGGSELGADCWAVHEGKRAGWLKWEDLAAICADWGDAPESDTHPSAARRCANLQRCWNN